jgi:hypothetical protein
MTRDYVLDQGFANERARLLTPLMMAGIGRRA